MNKDFEDLEEFYFPRSRTTFPIIKISGTGVITLTAGFLNHGKDQVLNNTHVILFFSKMENAIVFKFTSDESIINSIKMRVITRNNFSFSAKFMFTYYKIYIGKPLKKYIAKLETIPKIGKCWVVYL